MNMKKIIFALLAASAALVGCVKFEDDRKIDYDSTTAPDVTVQVVADDAIQVTVAGKTGTGFYSYAVIAGEAKELDADKLLSDSYAAIVSGVVDFSKESSVTVDIKELTPNTTYTAYAVAASTMGVVTEVKTASATTTDSTAPRIKTFESESTDATMAFGLIFDDPVTVTGKGVVTAHVYAINTKADENGNLVEYKTYTVPSANITAQGKKVFVTLPREEAIPGAIVTITYTAGLVANGVGAECAAFSNAAVAKDGSFNGIGEYYDNKAFDFALEEGWAADTVVYFGEWNKLQILTYSKGEYPIVGKTGSAKVKVQVVDGTGRTVTYDAVGFGRVDDATVGLMLNEDPGYGTSVSYTIAEGSFVDLFGNGNNEFTANDNYYCSYGYTLADIVGEYAVVGKSYFGEEYDEAESWVIAESDDPEKGNIKITTYWGIECDTPIYADFDKDAGIFSIPDYQQFKVVTLKDGSEGALYFACYTNDDGAVLNMKVFTPGTFTSNDLWFGYYLSAATQEQSRWQNLFKTVTAMRVK